MAKATEFHEKQVREDVKLNLPDGWKLRVFKVISGDSGKEYWVQTLIEKHPGGADEYRIMLCSCPQGQFVGAPLGILGLKDFWCKHAVALYEGVIKEKV